MTEQEKRESAKKVMRKLAFSSFPTDKFGPLWERLATFLRGPKCLISSESSAAPGFTGVMNHGADSKAAWAQRFGKAGVITPPHGALTPPGLRAYLVGSPEANGGQNLCVRRFGMRNHQLTVVIDTLVTILEKLPPTIQHLVEQQVLLTDPSLSGRDPDQVERMLAQFQQSSQPLIDSWQKIAAQLAEVQPQYGPLRREVV